MLYGITLDWNFSSPSPLYNFYRIPCNSNICQHCFNVASVASFTNYCNSNVIYVEYISSSIYSLWFCILYNSGIDENVCDHIWNICVFSPGLKFSCSANYSWIQKLFLKFFFTFSKWILLVPLCICFVSTHWNEFLLKGFELVILHK